MEILAEVILALVQLALEILAEALLELGLSGLKEALGRANRNPLLARVGRLEMRNVGTATVLIFATVVVGCRAHESVPPPGAQAPAWGGE